MVALAIAVLQLGLVAQSLVWDGAWASDGAHVAVIRNVHATPQGWDHLAENLTRASAYRIAIEHTDTSIAIAFPGGPGNILSIPRCAIGAEPQRIVTNQSGWWTKTIVSCKWTGIELEVSSVVSAGWLKDGSPDGATPKPTDVRKRLRLQPEHGADHLTLDVVIEDEKGALEYLQEFRRDR